MQMIQDLPVNKELAGLRLVLTCRTNNSHDEPLPFKRIGGTLAVATVSRVKLLSAHREYEGIYRVNYFHTEGYVFYVTQDPREGVYMPADPRQRQGIFNLPFALSDKQYLTTSDQSNLFMSPSLRLSSGRERTSAHVLVAERSQQDFKAALAKALPFIGVYPADVEKTTQTLVGRFNLPA